MRSFAARLLPFLLIAAVAGAMLQPIRSYDLWWHLATGRLMVAEGRIPQADPYSFTSPAAPWLDHEWFFELAAYLGFQHGGARFCLIGTLLMGLTAYLLLMFSLRDGPALAPAGWLLLAISIAGARFRFDFRPEMISYPLMVCLWAVLLKSRKERCARLAWLACPLFAVWANLHPAALLGAASLLVWLAGEGLQGRFGSPTFRSGPLRWRVLAVSPVCLLINPAGIKLFRVPFEIRRIVSSGHAPNQEWLSPRLADFPLFYASVLVAAACLLLATWVAVKENRRKGASAGIVSVPLSILDWGAVLVLILLACLGAQQLRNIAFFFLMLPLALARPASYLLEKAGSPSWAPRLAGGIVLALLVPVFLRGMPAWTEKDLLERITPEKAVRFLDANGAGERLFNDVKFGGYLIWKRFPAHQVFIDGRNEIYDALLADIFVSLGSWERWEDMLDRYRIDAAMLRRGQLQAVQYAPASPGAPAREMRAFSSAYFQKSHWALIYWDDTALIFVRRGEPAARNLADREYRLVNPDDAGHLLREIRAGRVEVGAALAEIERKLAEDPDCASAQRLSRQVRTLLAESPN